MDINGIFWNITVLVWINMIEPPKWMERFDTEKHEIDWYRSYRTIPTCLKAVMYIEPPHHQI